jgi:hypothetical protein
MKKIIVSESQIKKLLDSSINEQLGSGDTNAGPERSTISIVNRPVQMGSNLFKIGSDKINTGSSEFKNALSVLRTVPGATVQIQGGASAVGSDRGFDNQALAERRATNFVTALKNAGVDTGNYTILSGVVGKSTKANTPEANAEQFVRFTVKPTPGIKFDQKIAIDNTATKLPILPIGTLKPKTGTGNSQKYFVIFKFDYDTSVSNVAEIYNSVKNATEGKVTNITNVTKQFRGTISESEDNVNEDDFGYEDFTTRDDMEQLRDALNKNIMISVAYVKKDGTVKHMTIKRYLSAYVPSEKEKTQAQLDVEKNNDIKRVVDINAYNKALKQNGGNKEEATKKCWRTINLKDVLGFMVRGNFIDLRDENEIRQRFGEEIYNSLTKSMLKSLENTQDTTQ